jgi:hypothetical protein
MQPLIGITTNLAPNEHGQATVSLKQAYIDAIAQAS